MPTESEAGSGREGQGGREHRPDTGAVKSAVASHPGTESLGYPFIERRKNDRRKAPSADSGLWRAIAMLAGPGLWINFLSKEVVTDHHKVALTPKEFELLCLLASQPGRVYSDEEILNHLWPGNESATTAHVAQYVHRVRKKICDDPTHPQVLINVKRFGYKLNCDPCCEPGSEPPPVQRP